MLRDSCQLASWSNTGVHRFSCQVRAQGSFCLLIWKEAYFWYGHHLSSDVGRCRCFFWDIQKGLGIYVRKPYSSSHTTHAPPSGRLIKYDSPVFFFFYMQSLSIPFFKTSFYEISHFHYNNEGGDNWRHHYKQRFELPIILVIIIINQSWNCLAQGFV